MTVINEIVEIFPHTFVYLWISTTYCRNETMFLVTVPNIFVFRVGHYSETSVFIIANFYK